MGNCLFAGFVAEGDSENPKLNAVVPATSLTENKNCTCVLLYAEEVCETTTQILLALQYKGIQFETHWLEPDSLKSSELETDLNREHGGAIPLLIHGDHQIRGTQAILVHIDSNFIRFPLVPRAGIATQVQEWVAFINGTCSPLISRLLREWDPSVQEELAPKLEQAFSKLEDGLSNCTGSGPYFLGRDFSLVDVHLVPFLALADELTNFRGIGTGFHHPHLLMYRKNMEYFPMYASVKVPPESLRAYVALMLELNPPTVVNLILLQHRSVLCHLDKLNSLAKEVVSERWVSASDAGAKAVTLLKLKTLWKWYGRLREFMQEHAQMEERIIFPALEKLSKGVTGAALGEHRRDLPLTNGIREDLKAVLSLNQGSPDYGDALLALTSRMQTLQTYTIDHFNEEERKLLPLLKALGLAYPSCRDNSYRMLLSNSLSVMELSHAHLFAFVLAGLAPHDIYQYLVFMRQACHLNPDVYRKVLKALQNADDEFQYVGKVVTERFSTLAAIHLRST